MNYVGNRLLYTGEGSLFTMTAELADGVLADKLGLNRGFCPGKAVLLVTGEGSHERTQWWPEFLQAFRDAGIEVSHLKNGNEPTPEIVDEARRLMKEAGISMVTAVGGGSVIDTGKAAAALVNEEEPTETYLEGVGTRKPSGKGVSFVAVPTTAGTGSEATRNAVISRVGEQGFKKSLRHESFVPYAAVLDPALQTTCPKQISAASGLDAITQLIGAFLSDKACPLTDAYCRQGLLLAGEAFPRLLEDGNDLRAREDMAFAAYCSGIGLANAGLGLVHGIASPMGARYNIPHGVVCGRLLAPSVRYTTSRLMQAKESSAGRALHRYAEAGILLTQKDAGSDNGNAALLVDKLKQFSELSNLSGFSSYGVDEEGVRIVAAQSGMKNHPLSLSSDEISGIIMEAL
ncbi:MAG: iron-containing alcohol dehydrogenase [Spirochaetales bacterium]|nr:iron-containing alcohol dehydrogenase [Spirochaetales bacterium]MCF7938031.1 iron-containing alcohol dehydrogenase [Spirochaetales bacterium]